MLPKQISQICGLELGSVAYVAQEDFTDLWLGTWKCRCCSRRFHRFVAWNMEVCHVAQVDSADLWLAWNVEV